MRNHRKGECVSFAGHVPTSSNCTKVQYRPKLSACTVYNTVLTGVMAGDLTSTVSPVSVHVEPSVSIADYTAKQGNVWVFILMCNV